jgi:glutathione S-transferase
VKWDNLFLLPFVGFIQWPLAALLPAGVLGALFWRRRKRLIAVAAAVWALYAVYESLMKARVLCSGECNIRVDLLLLVPLLWILLVAALVSFFRRGRASGPA